MKQSISLIAVLMLAGIGFAQRSSAAESKFLTVGDVSKIDLKNRSITIKDATSYDLAQLGGAGGDSGARGGRSGAGVGGGGGGGGGGRGGGRGGRRGGGGGGSTSGTPRGAAAILPTEKDVLPS